MATARLDPVAQYTDDKPRQDGLTDEDAGVPAADFRNGNPQNDPDEWPEPAENKRNDNESIFDEGLDSGDDTVIPLEDPVPL